MYVEPTSLFALSLRKHSTTTTTTLSWLSAEVEDSLIDIQIDPATEGMRSYRKLHIFCFDLMSAY
jgi:hypothetical protein